MACSSSFGCSPRPQQQGCCVDEFGCNPCLCPDFVIRRHDTKPAFKVKIDDCDGPLDLTGLVLEASMWAKGKLKTALSPEDTYFALADNIGFNQIMVGDIIIMDRIRLPEYMLVTGFDEDNRLILVQRGYHGTTAQKWKRGTSLKILKFSDVQAQTEMIYQDVVNIDGSTTHDVLVDSFFVYEWGPNDTCLPGCYYMEFKLIKMIGADTTPNPDPDGDGDSNDTVDDSLIIYSPSVIVNVPSLIDLPDVVPFSISNVPSSTPTFTPPDDSPSTFSCGIGEGIEWIRRFPVDTEGFYIQITNTITAE